MSDTSKFKPSFSDIRLEGGELRFVLSGNKEYGLDKSVCNAIRRVLLTDIPTVGFKLSPTGDNNDLIMVTNNSSLHNEMLLHRISFMPLHIDPENYLRNHLFECKIIHDGKDPFKFITMNDIQIYPLKSGFIERLEKLHDKSYDLSPSDEKVLREQLSVVNIENYDLEKPLSQKEKDNIYRPYSFRGKNNYCLVTELKTTRTEETHQELHFYGSPSVGYGYEDAKFQGVSQASSSFQIDESLVTSVLKDKIKLDEIEKDDIESYSRKFRLREAERYFHRDMNDEPYSYDFAVKSNHYYDASKILKVSVKILIETCENFKLEVIEFLKEQKSRISVKEYKENIYHIEVENETHTLGNLLQSHVMRRKVNQTTIINLFGYKKPHPLEDQILFIVSMNPSHKLTTGDEITRLNNLFTYLMDCIDDLVNDLRILSKTTDKTF